MNLYQILRKDAIDRLKLLVRDGGAVETSQVKIIGLDDIRKMAGDTWPQVAARVRTNSIYFLERRLGENDVVVPAGDGFIVIYGKSEDEVDDDPTAKAALLQESLNSFFLGQEGMAALHSKVVHQTIPAGALAAMLGPGPVAAEPAPTEAVAAVPVRPELVFMPVWSVSKEAITGYWPIPVHRDGGLARYGHNPAWQETGVHGEADDHLALDLEILAHAVQGIEQGLATGNRCLIGYSVHSTTLQHRERRQAFLARLREVPAVVRPYLLGRIAELEPGAPAVTIAEWVHQLRVVSLRVTLELHHTERALSGLDGVGVFSVSSVLPARPAADNIRAYYSNFIQRWSATLRRQGLKFRLDNIADSQLMALVLEGAVDFCSSGHFWPAVDAPRGMRPYTHAQLRRELGLAAPSKAR